MFEICCSFHRPYCHRLFGVPLAHGPPRRRIAWGIHRANFKPKPRIHPGYRSLSEIAAADHRARSVRERKLGAAGRSALLPEMLRGPERASPDHAAPQFYLYAETGAGLNAKAWFSVFSGSDKEKGRHRKGSATSSSRRKIMTIRVSDCAMTPKVWCAFCDVPRKRK